MADELDDTEAGSAGPEHHQGPWRLLAWISIPLAVILAVALIWVLTRDDKEPVTSPPPSPTVDPIPSNPPETPRPQLERDGIVWAGSGGPQEGSYGPNKSDGVLLYGYSQTMEGCVMAAINYDVALSSPAIYDDAQRHRIYAHVFHGRTDTPGFTDEEIASSRKRLGLDEDGRPVDEGKTFFWGVYPALGAYQTVEMKGNTQCRVQVWAPQVSGIGNALSDLKVGWGITDRTLRWIDGDWRLVGAEEPREGPPPPDSTQVNPSFEDRAAVLGTTGWRMVANATTDWPADLPKG